MRSLEEQETTVQKYTISWDGVERVVYETSPVDTPWVCNFFDEDGGAIAARWGMTGRLEIPDSVTGEVIPWIVERVHTDA